MASAVANNLSLRLCSSLLDTHCVSWLSLRGSSMLRLLAMTLIDSAAAFDKRCDELRDGLKDLFHIVNIHTFSELAFAIGTPQTPVPDGDMQRFTDNLHWVQQQLGIVQWSSVCILNQSSW